MELPRYVCAAEVGFLPTPTEIAFAKLDYRVGVGQRVEQGDEFDYVGKPARWMDPINEAASAIVQELVQGGKRKTLSAEHAAPTAPVVPPRSGMASSLMGQANQSPLHVRDVNTGPTLSARPAPRRRAAKAN